MKLFIPILSLLIAGVANAQYGGLWNGGPFNPWNNPAHPANAGIARGIAARNLFAWPNSSPIQAAAISPAIASDPASDSAFPERQAAIDDLTQRKIDLETKIRQAALNGASLSAGFRPAFVNELLNERMQIVSEIRKNRQEMVRDRLALVAKRQQIAKEIVESNEPINFGLLMRSLNRAYGQEMAAKSIAHQRKIMGLFERPFLQPVVSVFAPSGLPSGAVAETKIYQNLQEQKGTLMKDEDIFVITKVSGFTGDKLHLGVDFHGVNKTSTDVQALSEDFLETELEFQDEMLESQMTLAEKWLEQQLVNNGVQSDLREKIMAKQLNKAEKLLELKNKLAQKKLDLEAKLAEKRREKQQKLEEKQQDLLEKQMEKQQKQLEKQADLEAKAMERQLDLAGGFNGNDLMQRQLAINAKRIERQLEFAKQQALLNNPYVRQESIQESLDFLRNRMQSFPKTVEELIFQKQMEKAADLEEKQREKAEKLMEKQHDLLEKQAEKQRDLEEKQREKEAKAAEKLRDELEKQLEKEQKLAEKEAELAEKQLEKEADKLQKQLEKEQKLAEKQAELVEKQLEKEADKLRKQLEKGLDLDEKEADLLQKQLEKEAEKALKQLEKAKDLEEKQKEKEQDLLQKQMEKERDLLEKQMEEEKKMAEKAEQLLEKQLEKERDLAEKQFEKEQKLAEKQQDLLEKQLEKEQDLAQKQLEKEKDLLEKQTELEEEGKIIYPPFYPA